MLARAHRFHGYGSLNSVYRQGQTVRAPHLSLRFVMRDAHKPYRVAVVVSRKVHKSAVVRNRIRRRIFAIVGQQDDSIQPGTDLIFSVFADQIATLEASKLQAIIVDLLKRTAPDRS